MTSQPRDSASLTDERASFEDWVLSEVRGATTIALYRRDMPGAVRLGEYVSATVEMMWQAWQAARSLSKSNGPNQLQGEASPQGAALDAENAEGTPASNGADGKETP